MMKFFYKIIMVQKQENGNWDKDIFVEEIKIIQDNIKRMSSNSFLIKGWVVTLFSAMLLINDNERYTMLFLIIPIILFWVLDAYFLRKERLFRKLYNWVIVNRMLTNEYLFDLNTNRFKDTVDSIIELVFSKSLFLFYITVIIVVLTIYLLTLFNIIT